jgi:hypothetical protein
VGRTGKCYRRSKLLTQQCLSLFCLEARGGIEPPNKGFADLAITTINCLFSARTSEIHHVCPAVARIAVVPDMRDQHVTQ